MFYFPQFFIRNDIIGYTICSNITGKGELSSVKDLLDDCGMVPLANMSKVGLIGRVEEYFDEFTNHPMAEFLYVSPEDGSCSDYGFYGVHISCARGKNPSLNIGELDQIVLQNNVPF